MKELILGVFRRPRSARRAFEASGLGVRLGRGDRRAGAVSAISSGLRRAAGPDTGAAGALWAGAGALWAGAGARSEEHTSELQSRPHLVCRLLLEKKKIKTNNRYTYLR